MVSEILPVNITAAALAAIKRIRAEKKIPEFYGLRIGVKGGFGCGGANYILGFDMKNEKDAEFRIDNVPVYIEKKQVMFLAGKEIDYQEGEEQGFTFSE